MKTGQRISVQVAGNRRATWQPAVVMAAVEQNFGDGLRLTRYHVVTDAGRVLRNVHPLSISTLVKAA